MRRLVGWRNPEQPVRACRLRGCRSTELYVFQEKHRAVKAGRFKGCIFLFQLFGRQHFTRCEEHHLSGSFCIWSSLPFPLILIINSMYGNFSLNHARNGNGYVKKKKYLKEGSTCLPRSQQHASSLPVWFSLQSHVREPTSHTNTK